MDMVYLNKSKRESLKVKHYYPKSYVSIMRFLKYGWLRAVFALVYFVPAVPFTFVMDMYYKVLKPIYKDAKNTLHDAAFEDWS